MAMALDLLESATGPRTTLQSPQRWNDDAEWKLNFRNIERIPPEEIARQRAQNDVVKEIAKGRREAAGLKTKQPDAAE